MTIGADLLASGVLGGDVRVAKFRLVRSSPQARSLRATRVHAVWSATGTAPAVLGGD